MKKVNHAMICLFLCFTLAANLTAFSQTIPALSQFDEDVAQCRRIVRDYCAIVQKMMQDSELDSQKQVKGLSLLLDARAKWVEIQKNYASNPPKEYANDAQFKARLQDFANALEDMEAALAAGKARRSFMACGFGCGLFVTMHEENGLSYALDALFHLRKTGKTTQALMKTRGLDAARPMIPALMKKFDIAQKSPDPWQESDKRMKPYKEAMGNLKKTLDDLSEAVNVGDVQKVNAIFSQLTNIINRPYGLAL